jgi:hypothetical protein
MTRAPLAKQFVMLAAVACLAWAGVVSVLAPSAHADPLDDLRGTVTSDRLKYGPACPPLKYNQTLQDIGFAQGQFIPDPPARLNGLIASYNGEVRSFIGTGNRQSQSTTDAYKKGAGSLIGNCDWTEYGVSFIRYEPTETDWVGIIMGKPRTGGGQSGGPGPSGPPAGQNNPAPVQCGPDDQTPTVPAGQQCKAKPKPPVSCPPGGPKTEVPFGQTCPAPTNQVTVTFDRGFLTWTVNVKNNAGIGGSCTYRATDNGGGLGASNDFDIDANGTASFDVPAPVVTRKYKVVTSCTGTYDGKQVEFGHNEQTVP